MPELRATRHLSCSCPGRPLERATKQTERGKWGQGEASKGGQQAPIALTEGGVGVRACERAGGMAGAEIEIDLDKLDTGTLRHLDRFSPPLPPSAYAH